MCVQYMYRARAPACCGSCCCNANHQGVPWIPHTQAEQGMLWMVEHRTRKRRICSKIKKPVPRLFAILFEINAKPDAVLVAGAKALECLFVRDARHPHRQHPSRHELKIEAQQKDSIQFCLFFEERRLSRLRGP